METDKHYLRVGSFVLATMLATALFSIWLVGAHNNGKYTLYRIRFNESVSGLDIGGPVKFQGVQIGKVEAMSIDPSDMRLTRIDISILKSTPIKTDTSASLKLQGITGGVYVELSGSSPEAPNLVSNNESGKDNPPEIPAEPSTMSTIMDQLPEILEKVSHIADQLDKLASDKNVAAITDMIGNLQKASKALAPSK